MDELEQRLSRMLNRVAEHANDSAVRLHNPADGLGARRLQAGTGRRAGWVTVAAGVAVAAVVGGVAVTLPQLQTSTPPAVQGPSPQPSSSPSSVVRRGSADGVHPLWAVTVRDAPRQRLADLPVGEPGPVPVPYTLNPHSTPELVKVPTLVTAAGTLRFPEATKVLLFAQRPQGTYIGVLGNGPDDQEGLFGMRLILIKPDGSQRELYRVPYANWVAVAPNGATVAVNTGPEKRAADPAVVLIDVAGGQAVHRLAGSFTGMTWTSDDSLLLQGPKDMRWQAPWTGVGEPVKQLPDTPVASVVNGAVLVDEKGCLQRIDATATVVAANCGGWRMIGLVSPNRRYLPLEWGAEDAPNKGILDLVRNEVRPWPVLSVEGPWLPDSQLLLIDGSNKEQSSAKARCDLESGICVRFKDGTTGTDLWRSASWLGR